MKRKVAMRKAAGDLKGAVELLNEYLQVFMADTEAWAELADLYTSLQTYSLFIILLVFFFFLLPPLFLFFFLLLLLLFTPLLLPDILVRATTSRRSHHLPILSVPIFFFLFF